MANAGINAAVGQEESFMVAFISFQTSLDAAFVKKPSGVGSGQRSWSTKTRLSLSGKKSRSRRTKGGFLHSSGPCG